MTRRKIRRAATTGGLRSWRLSPQSPRLCLQYIRAFSSEKPYRHACFFRQNGEVAHFAQGRLTPFVSNLFSALSGKDYTGQAYGAGELLLSFAPISLREAGKSIYENSIVGVHGVSNCKFQMKFSCVVQVRKTPEYISRQVRQVREVVFLGCFANLAY